jgi:hypothetical protein
VAQSLLSRFGPGIIQAFNGAMLVLGAGLALATQSYDLLVILLVVAPFIFSRAARERIPLPPLSIAQSLLLAAAYGGTFLFYATILRSLFGSPAG